MNNSNPHTQSALLDVFFDKPDRQKPERKSQWLSWTWEESGLADPYNPGWVFISNPTGWILAERSSAAAMHFYNQHLKECCTPTYAIVLQSFNSWHKREMNEQYIAYLLETVMDEFEEIA